MNKVIMVGADVHKENILLMIACDRQDAVEKSFDNTAGGRQAMYGELIRRKQQVGAAGIIFVYEASPVGFGLYDELKDKGIESYVLAPTNIARSAKHRRRKTDATDSARLLELVRGYVLAGNKIPAIWVPDQQTRNGRELVRTRLDIGKKIVVLKGQVVSLLARNSYRKPRKVGQNWSKRHRQWLGKSLEENFTLPGGVRLALGSLLRQLSSLEDEQSRVDRQVRELALEPRYRLVVEKLTELKGVGLLTAMVYLTEMGDLRRFTSRREVGSYLGLVPTSYESGNSSDRKGHITRQGPYRVRKVLCQASWSRVRTDEKEKMVYGRLVERNPKMKKIAVVASMRRLAVKMWHIGLRVQQETGVFTQAA